MRPEVAKAIFGFLIPASLTVAALLVAALSGRTKQQRGNAGAWALPAAVAAALAIMWLARAWDVRDRWIWALPASLAVSLAWAACLTPRPRRRRSRRIMLIATALITAGAAGALMWPTYFSDQSLGERLLLPGFILVAALLLYPLARGAHVADLACIALCAASLAPIVLWCGVEVMMDFILPLAAIPACAAALGWLIRGRRRHQRRRAFAAGGYAVALILPIWAMSAWSSMRDDLPMTMAIALPLPCCAVLLLWIGRIPALARRPWLAALASFLAVAAACAAAIWLGTLGADLEVYELPPM